MIIDTHAHYDDEAFAKDQSEVLNGLFDKGVATVVNATASMNGCGRTMEMIEKYPFVYGMQGVHPDDVGELTEADMDIIHHNAQHDKIVAIGEIGLDYHWDIADHDTQKKWFVRQMEVARELKMPICVHSRDAAADTLSVMKEARASEIGGVIHCYSYSAEMAKEFLNMGFYFGIGGVATFKNGRKCKETIDVVPLERIVLETDAPYLAPEPFRGKRNDSSLIAYVAEEIAKIKGVSAEEVIRQTAENAHRVYPKLSL